MEEKKKAQEAIGIKREEKRVKVEQGVTHPKEDFKGRKLEETEKTFVRSEDVEADQIEMIVKRIWELTWLYLDPGMKGEMKKACTQAAANEEELVQQLKGVDPENYVKSLRMHRESIAGSVIPDEGTEKELISWIQCYHWLCGRFQMAGMDHSEDEEDEREERRRNEVRRYR